MAEQKVELRKIRDFSENLNDTFAFITQNFAPLVTSFLAIAGIFLLATAIFNGMYQSRFTEIFQQIIAGREIIRSPFQYFSGYTLFSPLLSWISMTAMHVTIIAYIKIYATEGGHKATLPEVWEVFKKYFLKVLIYTIPISLLTGVGFVFCVFPAIYFLVAFLPFPVVLIMEDQTFSGAFNRCFTLIKENFWLSLGLYIVVYLIYAIAAGIISATMAGVAGILSYLTTNDIRSTIAVAASVLGVFSFLFYIVFYISVALHYFTLTEKYDGTGMMQRLDKLGEGGNDFNNTGEQY